MATLCSFDITSNVDLQEVDNALNQARKEVGQRYDFKGAKVDIEFNKTEKKLTIAADDRMKLEALWEIIQTRLVRREVPVKNLKPGEIEQAAGGSVKRVIELQQGIPSEAAKEIVKFLKDQKLKKVQAAIQADQVRVTAPARDDLQAAIQLLRATISAWPFSSGTTAAERPVPPDGRCQLTPGRAHHSRVQPSDTVLPACTVSRPLRRT